LKNKARFAQWARLGSKTGKVPDFARPSIAIKILDLPGFRNLEDKYLIYSGPKGQPPHGVEEIAERLSLETFGIRVTDTDLPYPADYDSWPWDSDRHREFEEARERHDEQFETLDASDEEAVEILLGLGIDFRDELGNPMKSVSLFCLQAEAAVKGIAGRLPDRNTVNEKRMTMKLEDEAKAFLAKKKKL
jgi:hypothetical protein